MLHKLLVDNPAVKRSAAFAAKARDFAEGVLKRDRAAIGAWEDQVTAAARRGEPSPPRPEPTPDNVTRKFREEANQAAAAQAAVLRDVGPGVLDELLARQGEIFVEVAAMRERLVLLAVELCDLAGSAQTLDRAANIYPPRGHLLWRPGPGDLIKAVDNGTLWVAD